MASRKQTSARNAQRQSEADANFSHYNEGRGGTVIDVEGETVGETSPPVAVEAEPEPELPPDTSLADAAATQTALAVIPICYSVTKEKTDVLRVRARKVTFKTPEGYEEGRKLLALLRSLSGLTERTRKTLKAPVLERGDRIDEGADEIKRWLNEIRDELQALKDDEDAERAKRRRAAEDAERERIRLEAEAKLAAERAELEALRAENARIAEEQRVARVAAEAEQAEARRAFEAERRAFAEAQAQLEADRRVLEQGSRDLALAQEVIAVLQVHAESESASAEVTASWSASLAASRVSQSEIDAAIVESTSSIPPDMRDWVSPPAIAGEAAAIREFARQIRALKAPTVTSAVAGAIVEQVESMLSEAAEALESFELEAATAAE